MEVIRDHNKLLEKVCELVRENLSPPGTRGRGKYKLTELADLTGVSKSYLAKINKGENTDTIGIDIVFKLANFFKVFYHLSNCD